MQKVENFQKAVLDYWLKHGRNTLPWRKTRDPYKILVSEIMLQQTQVDRVVPYFNRWMKKFPTVQALAKSDFASVLKIWSGLGYNRRAKLLRECAKEIVAKHGGKVPESKSDLIGLPGVGPYTAGAIRAFAFNKPDIVIETNIRSALLHCFFPKSKKVPDSKLIPILEVSLPREDLEARLPSSEPRAWYAALMDYGAHIKKAHPNPSRRSKHHVKQSKFDGSARQVRGAIIRRLLNGPISQKNILNVSAKDAYQISRALRSLEADGMIEKRGKNWHLAEN